ncbi:outer membrane beta-barrel protein [Flavobacterium sp. W21_SRS_FM6]|uniref:outer membrane beta-barrel protein n=1 Tax=Flavobacterium sp. W21_SRS_FM6 TaxID=3240268 RepID=UPI003F91D486
MSRFKNTILISVSMTSILGGYAQAQEKASLPVGTFELTPTLKVTLLKDSNVLRTNDNKLDSWVTVLNPELKLGKQVGENSITVGVSASKGIYHSSDADDYDDYSLFANGAIEFDRRNRLSGSLVHLSGHDARGTSYSNGAGEQLTSPDQFTTNTFDATYSYGALTASANIDVNMRLRDIDYDLDILPINPNRLRDRKEKSLGSTFYYGVSPTTDLLIEGRYLITDYLEDIIGVSSLDSNTKSILAGAKWESTAATSGFAKIGYEKREYDEVSRDGFSGLKWEAGVAWNPIERAVFEFSTASDTRETNGQGNYIRRIDYVVDWRHEWLERFDTVATFAYSDDSYEGTTVLRNDKTKEFSIAANYQFRRWLKFITAVSYFDRNSDSETTNFDYNRSLVSFTAQISL